MGFQGTDGLSVYDAGGALAFRVDNYSRRRKIFAGELTLMDGHGAPLLSLRPQVRPRSVRRKHAAVRFSVLGFSLSGGLTLIRSAEGICWCAQGVRGVASIESSSISTSFTADMHDTMMYL
jgi:hypothetical protein